MSKITFIEQFHKLKDYRQTAKVAYPLHEILLLALCGTIANCDSYVEKSLWGAERIDYLRTLSPFEHGVPSHDTLSHIFKTLDHKAFSKLFAEWVQGLRKNHKEIIAIDGKTVCGSKDKDVHALHVLSAFAAGQQLVLGQMKTASKMCEIKEIPVLLQSLVIAGAIVTIDAMGCQKEIADRIRTEGGDYVLALKDNQKDLRETVVALFKDQEKHLPCHQTVDADHGRIETRKYYMVDVSEWIAEFHPGWTDLRSVGMVVSMREKDGKITEERRYYIASLAEDLPQFAFAVRSHWSIENSLHWVLDVVFRDDDSRIRKKNAAMNMSILKHASINMINQTKGKWSIKYTRKSASWNDKTMNRTLFGA